VSRASAADAAGGEEGGASARSRAAPVIAIDGPAGAGKSTTARRVARALGFAYVDSGALYRAAALMGLREGWVGEERVDAEALARALAGAHIEQATSGDATEVRLAGEEVGEALRSPAVSRAVSRVAAEPEVRRVVTAKLRDLARGRPTVMDGRDIGTAVFPDAELKIFLDASLEERARRRSAAERTPVPPDALAHRDALDRGRAVAPLSAAPDAVVLQSDELTLEDQVERILRLWRARGLPPLTPSERTG
jgi:cytidylate kinase